MRTHIGQQIPNGFKLKWEKKFYEKTIEGYISLNPKQKYFKSAKNV